MARNRETAVAPEVDERSSPLIGGTRNLVLEKGGNPIQSKRAGNAFGERKRRRGLLFEILTWRWQ